MKNFRWKDRPTEKVMKLREKLSKRKRKDVWLWKPSSVLSRQKGFFIFFDVNVLVMLLKVGLTQEHPWVHWEKGAEGCDIHSCCIVRDFLYYYFTCHSIFKNQYLNLKQQKEECVRDHACFTKEDKMSNTSLRCKDVCLRLPYRLQTSFIVWKSKFKREMSLYHIKNHVPSPSRVSTRNLLWNRFLEWVQLTMRRSKITKRYQNWCRQAHMGTALFLYSKTRAVDVQISNNTN